MKKFINLLSVSVLAMGISATAMACPKGTTLVGGTGPNHKGGSCVPKDQANVNPSNNSVKTEPVPYAGTTKGVAVERSGSKTKGAKVYEDTNLKSVTTAKTQYTDPAGSPPPAGSHSNKKSFFGGLKKEKDGVTKTSVTEGAAVKN